MTTAVILVNWNGADDTIACLESLSRVEESHFVVIADNNSTDDSVQRISEWLKKKSEVSPVVEGYQLLQLDANYGFAIGNNKAVTFAMQRNPDFCMLLNNDTEVEPDFLKRLTEYACNNRDIKVLSPCICYYYDKQKVWFSGGKLTFGSRRNIYAENNLQAVGKAPFNIDFVSGCALFFETSVLNEKKELLYNGFFFGEEDYEFSLRMREHGVRMACVPASRIYHKVGASQKNTNDTKGAGRIYMYYHNRLICNRLYENVVVFYIILLLNSMTCLKYFRRYTGSWSIAFRMLKRLVKDVKTKNTFDEKEFRSLMFDNSYFDFDITAR